MKLTNSKLKKRVDALMEDFYKNDNENTLEILKMESERLLSVTEYPKAHIALALYYSNSEDFGKAVSEINQAIKLENDNKFIWAVKKEIAKKIKDKKMMAVCDKKIEVIQKESTVHICSNCNSKFPLTKKQMKEVEDYLPGEVSCPECFNKLEIK